MTEARLHEIQDLSRVEKRLRELKKHFELIALKNQAPDIVGYSEKEDWYRMERILAASSHLSLGAWMRIASIIDGEWEQAKKAFEDAS